MNHYFTLYFKIQIISIRILAFLFQFLIDEPKFQESPLAVIFILIFSTDKIIHILFTCFNLKSCGTILLSLGFNILFYLFFEIFLQKMIFSENYKLSLVSLPFQILHVIRFKYYHKTYLGILNLIFWSSLLSFLIFIMLEISSIIFILIFILNFYPGLFL